MSGLRDFNPTPTKQPPPNFSDPPNAQSYQDPGPSGLGGFSSNGLSYSSIIDIPAESTDAELRRALNDSVRNRRCYTHILRSQMHEFM
jgi:hypothetical protein